LGRRFNSTQSDEPDPSQENCLKGKSRPQGPSRNAETLRVHRHVNICRENGNQQRNQPPPCRPSKRASQQPQAACNLSHATDDDKHSRRREHWRNNVHVKIHHPKMIEAGTDKKKSRHAA
jgi:hypothetical protein